ncbi:transposon Tf2-6 polyprotein [Trichonephila clavipes]|nr:transposon Tf2-6 polyprotein [Trichonephila clavipes]
MCIDYRKLNQKLVKDKFPLSLIEDALATLQVAKVYSTLDLCSGFFHVDFHVDCRKYTSFMILLGVFQRYVSSIFRDLTRKGIVISYLDDLVIPAKREKEGHIVQSGTIKPSPTKTLAVRKFPEPTTIKQVQRFLELTGFIRHISEGYAKKDLFTRIARWALQLEEFEYGIEHRAGSRMKHVDALSRYPVMIVCNDTLTSKLKKAQEEDDNI